ncbi:uncharacterized protein V1518DRAFT_415879 [Limtongia smithiae]|uniref:uncharacterized protein n=1 Tax=Limtongia smithiae TaxID=1125753 RepID=UPI0034CF083B
MPQGDSGITSDSFGDNDDELYGRNRRAESGVNELIEFLNNTAPPGMANLQQPSRPSTNVSAKATVMPKHRPLMVNMPPSARPSTSRSSASRRPSQRTVLRTEREFKQTASGRPQYDDLTAIFATLLASLPLDKHLVGLFSTEYDFSFTSEEAIANLMNLKVKQSISSNDSSGHAVSSMAITTYHVDRRNCHIYMQAFFDAAFIRSATTPELEKFTIGKLWQPTPKGIAILDIFSQRNGLKTRHVSSLVGSVMNSMKLVKLERDHKSDQIAQSDKLIDLVFQRFAGRRPNHGSAVQTGLQSTSSTAALPPPSRAGRSIDVPQQSIFSTSSPRTVVVSSSHGVIQSGSPRSPSPPPSRHSSPESELMTAGDCYSESASGVRVYDSKRIHLREYRYCFSGLAAKNWVMDCTTVLNMSEAESILAAFLRQELIMHIERNHDQTKFLIDKHTYYTFTSAGKALAGWSRPLTTSSIARNPSPPQSSNISVSADNGERLRQLLADPALRLLFREHLADSLCEENLVFYIESDKLLSQYQDLEQQGFNSLNQVNLCISEAWMAYHTFLVPGSASEVNIDSALRARVCEGMSNVQEVTASSKNSEEYLSPLDTAVQTLKQIMSLLNEVRHQVFMLMASDSVPKFLKTNKDLDIGS